MNNIDVYIFIFQFIFSLLTRSYYFSLINKTICLKKNYMNKTIPIGMGVIFTLNQTILCIFLVALGKIDTIYISSYLVCILLMGLAGLIDDLLGEENAKGIVGHFKLLLNKKLTTGILKAFVGVLSSIFISFILYNTVIILVIDVFIISLFTNLINLFDLRPGRASKVFILLSILLLLFQKTNKYNFLLTSLLGIVMAYLPIDLKKRVMMGDVGANVLGMTLGIYCVLSQEFYVKLLYISVLILMHLISEFYSFSKVIEKNKILNYIDKLGIR